MIDGNISCAQCSGHDGGLFISTEVTEPVTPLQAVLDLTIEEQQVSARCQLVGPNICATACHTLHRYVKLCSSLPGQEE